MAKISHEKWKVYGNVFDNYTNRLLFKISSQGHYDQIASPVSIGKEANIFTAHTKDKRHVIIKIYRLESCNFNKMYDYIKSDQRFVSIKKQRRKVIFMWVSREYQNLLKARELGVRVPTPLTVTDHILVLEMIGKTIPAPKLKDYGINHEIAKKIIDMMKKMYKGGLVHGDLSEFNILVDDGVPVFIDFSQSTIKNDPNYNEYWQRDILNMARYFKKTGIKITGDELKKMIFNQ